MLLSITFLLLFRLGGVGGFDFEAEIQGTFSFVQGTFAFVQGTRAFVQGTFAFVQGTFYSDAE